MSSFRKPKNSPLPSNWPSEAELKRIRKQLSRVKGVELLPPDATAIDHDKWDLCAEFIKYKHSENITQVELARRLSVSEARVSEIVHYRIRKLTMDQLLKYFERIRPNFRLRVA